MCHVNGFSNRRNSQRPHLSQAQGFGRAFSGIRHRQFNGIFQVFHRHSFDFPINRLDRESRCNIRRDKVRRCHCHVVVLLVPGNDSAKRNDVADCKLPCAERLIEPEYRTKSVPVRKAQHVMLAINHSATHDLTLDGNMLSLMILSFRKRNRIPEIQVFGRIVPEQVSYRFNSLARKLTCFSRCNTYIS